MLSYGHHKSCLKQTVDTLRLETVKYYFTTPMGPGSTISTASTQICVGFIETLDTEIIELELKDLTILIKTSKCIAGLHILGSQKETQQRNELTAWVK